MPRKIHAVPVVKKRRLRPGNMTDLMRSVWRALIEAEGVLVAASGRKDEEMILRSVHAVIQAGAAYAKLLEAHDWEGRLAAIEAQLQGQAA